MINNEIANFTGNITLGDDGLKFISEIIKSFYKSSDNKTNNLVSNINLGNLDTNINYFSTPSAKKNLEIQKNQFSSSISNPGKEVNFFFSGNYKLKEIKLNKCNIGDEGFSILANCFDKPGSVQIIHLKGNKIKDKSYKNIIHLIKNNLTLKNLVLSLNMLSVTKKENIKINSKILNHNLKIEL